MERLHYDALTDRIIEETIYDPTEVIEQNAIERAEAGQIQKYVPNRAGLVKVASIPEEHVVALRNKGYDLYSSDKDEVRRALVYIQQHEPVWLTVNGKPFANWRPKWA